MAIEFCPLEAAWGNWADWAAVLVGTGAAVGTIWVASVANRTSKRAAAIAEDAKAIAKQQSDQAVELREANAAILGRLLLHEVSSLPARLHSLLKPIIASVYKDGDKIRINNHQNLEQVLRDASYSMLPQSESVLERIHDLPDSLAPDLATLIGHCWTLRDMAYRMQGRVKQNDRKFIGQPDPWIYLGSPDDFNLLQEHLRFFVGLGADYANRFRSFVEVPAEDYSRFT
ncbi:hypothetical protein SOM22_08445 [Stenotrophomonas rhizophila]|uniref:hypothetical protein n=1 Tax=Stenotrophomonas rhizophila TaxID=216778 RepID=UPI002A69EE2E|nr:hypothetical protein [Stenotrophomonas rhizophila]MDY0954603.1 hypothetical protein [Stenotrophomonas rhizophila]